ncbi:MAG: TIGR04283 family arsenosugar biosynthesis glycosyltransferase [Candidatus Omnitrophica bacterium]|nr:TIGR04283 family arsenosugar biosynthesis glycosyltransferase [Candidatus Omnitrophota bacterium]MCB9748333.1 TIGR04283 family arsenosugar biosynthesis glycosyltransferase [Candidatus Omnitrophota bacterium]
MISVIIPVYNEEKILLKNELYFKSLSELVDLIFVDGGSKDRTKEIATDYGRVFNEGKCRAKQMNRGAMQAKEDILFFLHADAVINKENIEQIRRAVYGKNIIGGCFRQVIDQPGLIYRWIAFTGNVRAKFQHIYYGDQGIFVRKDIFQDMKGFPDLPICEDIFFTKALKTRGNVSFLNCPIYCSARRWLKQGILKTYFQNLRINLALSLGEDLNRLAREYQDVREK